MPIDNKILEDKIIILPTSNQSAFYSKWHNLKPFFWHWWWGEDYEEAFGATSSGRFIFSSFLLFYNDEKLRRSWKLLCAVWFLTIDCIIHTSVNFLVRHQYILEAPQIQDILTPPHNKLINLTLVVFSFLRRRRVLKSWMLKL